MFERLLSMTKKPDYFFGIKLLTFDVNIFKYGIR